MRTLLFFHRIVDWATTEQAIDALALAGSYAHGTAHSQSDVDLQFLTQHRQAYFKCTAWIEQFGDIASLEIEDWGAVKTLRVCYRADFHCEFEFNFAELSWASVPLDLGTARVITDGMKILLDKSDLLAFAQRAIR